MKRILISQNEKNYGTENVVVDGELINDEDHCLQYFKKVKETDNWELNFKDDFLELKSYNNNILLKSHYLDKDSVNRNIYYIYLVENNDNLHTILKYLQKDSQIIHRDIDQEKTIEIINRIKSNKKIKSSMYILTIVLASVSIAYIIINQLNVKNG